MGSGVAGDKVDGASVLGAATVGAAVSGSGVDGASVTGTAEEGVPAPLVGEGVSAGFSVDDEGSGGAGAAVAGIGLVPSSPVASVGAAVIGSLAVTDVGEGVSEESGPSANDGDTVGLRLTDALLPMPFMLFFILFADGLLLGALDCEGIWEGGVEGNPVGDVASTDGDKVGLRLTDALIPMPIMLFLLLFADGLLLGAFDCEGIWEGAAEGNSVGEDEIEGALDKDGCRLGVLLLDLGLLSSFLPAPFTLLEFGSFSGLKLPFGFSSFGSLSFPNFLWVL